MEEQVIELFADHIKNLNLLVGGKNMEDHVQHPDGFACYNGMVGFEKDFKTFVEESVVEVRRHRALVLLQPSKPFRNSLAGNNYRRWMMHIGPLEDYLHE